GNGQTGEALGVERGAEEGKNFDLLGGAHVATFLFAIGVPPFAGGFVEGRDGCERNTPVLFGVAGDGREVMGEVGVVGGIEIVVGGLCAAGRIVVAAHPPHRGVGEEFEAVGAPVTGHEQHGSLICVHGPIPTGGFGVGIAGIDPEPFDLPVREDVGGDDHAAAVEFAPGAGASVVANDVEAKAGKAFAVYVGG